MNTLKHQESIQRWQKLHGLEYQRNWRKKNPEKTRAYDQKFLKLRTGNPAYHNKVNARRQKLKFEIMTHYGGACICCGENHIEFLTIDHINGDGKKHRKEIGPRLYAWLKRNNFPKDNFQILCFNCNNAKAHFGYCPHQSKGSSEKTEMLSKAEPIK